MEAFVGYSSLKFAVLYGLEAVAFLVAAAYCVAHLRGGAWAVLGAVGGLIGGAAAALPAFGWARVEWAGDFGVFDFMARHDVLLQADWGRPVAVGFLAVSLVAAYRRTRVT